MAEPKWSTQPFDHQFWEAVIILIPHDCTEGKHCKQDSELVAGDWAFVILWNEADNGLVIMLGHNALQS